METTSEYIRRVMFKDSVVEEETLEEAHKNKALVNKQVEKQKKEKHRSMKNNKPTTKNESKKDSDGQPTKNDKDQGDKDLNSVIADVNTVEDSEDTNPTTNEPTVVEHDPDENGPDLPSNEELAAAETAANEGTEEKAGTSSSYDTLGDKITTCITNSGMQEMSGNNYGQFSKQSTDALSSLHFATIIMAATLGCNVLEG